MSAPAHKPLSQSSHTIADQGMASWVHQLNLDRQIPLHEALEILQTSLDQQDQALSEALGEINSIRQVIGSPESILGNPATKHGEIAEVAEVGIQRARDVLYGKTPNAFMSEDRLGPIDYHIDGVNVQSKFINGTNNTLRHILEHGNRYPDFATAGTKEFYHIPKDQFDQIHRIMNGDNGDLSARSVNALKESLKKLEAAKGRPWEEIIRPASHDYSDVQLGKIHETVESHESNLKATNEAIKENIEENHRENIESAKAKAAPSWGEVGKVAVTGAVVGAGIQITLKLYQKARDGKKISSLTTEDWCEVLKVGASGAAVGSISAASIYALTNFANLSAPFAGAVVSSGRAVVSLANACRKGEISLDEFCELSLVATTEAGIVAVGAALGQTLIPIPVLGALIGSVAAQWATAAAKQVLDDKFEIYVQHLEKYLDQQMTRIDEEHRRLLAQLEARMLSLGELTDAAFQVDANARLLLLNSARLAESYHVSEERIMKTIDDVDNFILGTRPTDGQVYKVV